MLYDKRWEKRKAKETKSLSQIYNEAADLIRDNGHSRGSLRASDGSMCVWGAISQVVDGNPFEASGRSMKMLEPLSKMVGTNIIGWNNMESRTKRQVLGLLRKAARKVVGPQETAHD